MKSQQQCQKYLKTDNTIFPQHTRTKSLNQRISTIESNYSSRHKSFRLNIREQSLKKTPHHIDQQQHCPRLNRNILKATSKKSNFIDTLSSFKYNKWFIKPQKRMRLIPTNRRINKKQLKTQTYEIYQNLYQEYIIDKQNPLNVKINQSISNIDKVPQQSVQYIQSFREKLQSRNQRVPKIIQIFMQKRQPQYYSQRSK